jgi:FkbM family methyltransferase
MTLIELIRDLIPPFFIKVIKQLFANSLNHYKPILNHIELRSGIQLKIHPESVIPFEYFRTGNPSMINEMNDFLSLTAGKFALLDIGALHGIFSLAFTANHQNRQAIAVDASPFAFARLLYNIHSNPTFLIRPVELALSDYGGEMQMRFEWEHAVASGSNVGAGFKVNTLTGDELCRQMKFVPDVIKIDVEGHEWHVLQGLKTILQQHSPLLFIEIHPSRLHSNKRSAAEVLNFLKTLSYNCVSKSIIFENKFLKDCENSEDIRLIFSRKFD